MLLALPQKNIFQTVKKCRGLPAHQNENPVFFFIYYNTLYPFVFNLNIGRTPAGQARIGSVLPLAMHSVSQQLKFVYLAASRFKRFIL